LKKLEQKETLMLKRVILPLVSILILLVPAATPARSLDLGPSSNYLIRVTPEAKAVIEKTLGAHMDSDGE
jgi:hypothetical protein